MIALLYEALKGENCVESNNINNEIKIKNPWDYVNLTKKERIGKTYKELQIIRKQKWEECNLKK